MNFGPVPEVTAPNPHVESIALHLYRAARDSARVALRQYVSDDSAERLQAALAAGAAAEYLLRAVIASRDPVLLAPPREWSSQIALSRANRQSPLDLRKLRTVPTADALKLLREISPTTPIADFTPVMEVRNAAAHMAMVDGASLSDAIQKLVNIAESLHALVDATTEDFWGEDLSSLVSELQSEYFDAVRTRLESKYVYARARLGRVTEGLSAAEREATLRALETRTVPWSSGDDHKNEDQACPACGRNGVMTYVVSEYGDPETEVDDDGLTPWHFRAIYYESLMFQCPVCGLHLQDGEIAAAGLDDEHDVEYEQIEDPYADFEPDPDFF